MGFCDWCNKDEVVLNSIVDITGEAYFVCKSCQEKYENGICRRCGKQIGKSLLNTEKYNGLIRGLCNQCYQVHKANELRIQNDDENQCGIDMDGSQDFSINENYEMIMTNWMSTFNTGQRNYNKQLTNLWIMMKAMVNNISDQDLNNNIDDIHTMVKRSFDKIVDKNCDIVIGKPSDDKIDIIDHLNNSYIVYAGA